MTAPALRDQIDRLAAAVADLRLRVREAVGRELARAVARAVRDAVEAALGAPTEARPEPPRSGDEWRADRHDGWDDGWCDADDEPGVPHRPPNPAAPAPHPAEGLPAALSAGVAAGRWWHRRTGSAPQGVLVGALVAAAALAGGTLAAAASVAASAAGLADPG